MLLSDVVVLFAALALLGFVPVRLIAEQRLSLKSRGRWAANQVAMGLICVAVLFMSFRSLSFGVDTIAYAELFSGFCAGRAIDNNESSFALSIWLLNAAMLGACDASLLPAAWVATVIAAVAICAGQRVPRARYAALLLVSMIGIELTTNAMRQGLAVGLLVAAVSHWSPRRWLSGILVIAALALHNSMSLAIAAVALSSLPWRWFVPSIFLLVIAIITALDMQIELAFVQPFIYEIGKYLAHENEEIWIRVLAFASVLIALTTPLACTQGGAERRRLVCDPHYNMALRIAVTCIPLLVLPYFGYRYIYAVYPIILWLSLSAASASLQSHGRHFALTLALNFVVLFGWSLGSSYMREVPFFD